MTKSPPVTGGLAWAGLAAADATRAVDFYCAAFDWQPSAAAGFVILRRAGKQVALVYPQTPQARAANVTTHWTPFFVVDDMDAAVARAGAAGGMALRDPFDVPAGRIAAMQDPGGAPFSLWAPRRDDGPAPSATGLWFMELATSDPDAAQAFYAHLLGWTYTAEGGAVTIHGPDGELGRIRQREGVADWLAYLRVPVVEEAARRAEALGATRLGVTEIDGLGRVARIVDPQRATLGLREA
jgi:predicted enzyme related to lactoylglutathione lyase